jgi:serine/threonine protein kinase
MVGTCLGIVPILDALEDERAAAVIMPFAGEALDRVLLAAGGRLSPFLARDILARIAEVLAHVHRMGILHRDVKPATVLVERDRETWYVRLTDFGIAVPASRSSATPRHIAPCTTSGYARPGARGGRLIAICVICGSDDRVPSRVECAKKRRASFPI